MKALTTPISITGTAKEIDAQFPAILSQYVESHVQLQETLDRANSEIAEAVKAIDERNKAKAKDKTVKKEEKSKNEEPKPEHSTRSEGSISTHLRFCSPCFNTYLACLERARLRMQRVRRVQRIKTTVMAAIVFSLIWFLLITKSRRPETASRTDIIANRGLLSKCMEPRLPFQCLSISAPRHRCEACPTLSAALRFR
jgi:hypothetical protein